MNSPQITKILDEIRVFENPLDEEPIAFYEISVTTSHNDRLLILELFFNENIATFKLPNNEIIG